ncbi:MAG: DUF6152 family protein [Gammaproteobacteria bacterium]
MKPRQTLLLGLLTLISAEGVYSHHARSPVYDASRSVTVEGLVTEFNFYNPHAMISLDVTDDAGKLVNWSIELPGRLNLTVGGWTDDSVTVGERVAITGNPTYTGSSGMWLERLIRADGSELLLPGTERSNALEDERRRRIEERDQQK